MRARCSRYGCEGAVAETRGCRFRPLAEFAWKLGGNWLTMAYGYSIIHTVTAPGENNTSNRSQHLLVISRWEGKP